MLCYKWSDASQQFFHCDFTYHCHWFLSRQTLLATSWHSNRYMQINLNCRKGLKKRFSKSRSPKQNEGRNAHDRGFQTSSNISSMSAMTRPPGAGAGGPSVHQPPTLFILTHFPGILPSGGDVRRRLDQSQRAMWSRGPSWPITAQDGTNYALWRCSTICSPGPHKYLYFTQVISHQT